MNLTGIMVFPYEEFEKFIGDKIISGNEFQGYYRDSSGIHWEVYTTSNNRWYITGDNGEEFLISYTSENCVDAEIMKERRRLH